MLSPSSPPDVTIAIERGSYTVSESSRRVPVCVRQTGQSDLNSTVSISTVPGSAGIYQLSMHFSINSSSCIGGILASAMSNFTHVNSCRYPI